jgi:DNA-binding CsgD family transcriptional regulator
MFLGPHDERPQSASVLTAQLRRELLHALERVAELVAVGQRNREVALALGLSVRTVETHLDNVHGKLGFKNRTRLAAAWISGGRDGLVAW